MFKLYYPSVNRGLSFTKPGLYTIGYVMAIGLLAIITGINGLYMIMSTGLSLLIVSGLISERVMRYTKVLHIDSLAVDADSSFDIQFSVQNLSDSFTNFGVEIGFSVTKPTGSLMSKDLAAPIYGKAIKILPKQTTMFAARCSGLPRGHIETLYVTQRTNYPFGFLEKFKISELKCGLIVAPALDHNFLGELSSSLQKRKAHAEIDKEFYTHSPYTNKDPIKYIDWRRSAGKSTKDWVIKHFKSENPTFHYLVRGFWDLVRNCQNQAAYEGYLSRLRTAIRALSSEQGAIGLALDGIEVWGEENILTYLATAPDFANRKNQNPAKGSDSAPIGDIVTLAVFENSFDWGTRDKRNIS